MPTKSRDVVKKPVVKPEKSRHEVTPIKKITPGTVRGLSLVSRSSNVIPANVVPARIGGNMEGTIPGGALLPSSVVVTQGFHPGHTALDLAGPQGTPIYAPEDLKISQAGKGAFGIDVIGINPDTGNRFTFGHFEAVAPGISPGELVPAGTLIGFEGSTFTPPGYSTGPHLHLQENLPGGGAVMPSAQDMLKTFVTGLKLPASSMPSVTFSGNVNAPVVNTSLLAGSPASIRAANTTNRSAAAVNSPTIPEPTPAASGASAVVAAPLVGVSSVVTPVASVAAGGAKVGGFLAGHAALDYAAMAAGLLLVIFGFLMILGRAGSWTGENLNPQRWQLNAIAKAGETKAGEIPEIGRASELAKDINATSDRFTKRGKK
jgi:hypothetical protein